MPAKQLSPERHAEVMQLLETYRKERDRPTGTLNVANALHFSDPEILEYRGKSYPIEPISATDGLRLMQLGAEIEAASANPGTGPKALGQFVSLYRKLVRTIGRLARPSGWRGVAWRLRPNPFRHATMGEVKEILTFFGRCQTRSSVRYRTQEESGDRPPSTSRN